MRITPQRLFACILAGFVALTGSLLGQEQAFNDFGFAVTPPDGWLLSTIAPAQPGLLATFKNMSGSRMLMVMYQDTHNPTMLLNEKFFTTFEDGREKSSGIKPLAGKFFQLGNIDAHEEVGTVAINDKTASSLGRIYLIDGKLYNFEVLCFDEDADKDPAIQKSLDSFRLLNARPPSTTPSPPPATNDNVAYKIGEFVGALLVIVVAIFIVVNLRKK